MKHSPAPWRAEGSIVWGADRAVVASCRGRVRFCAKEVVDQGFADASLIAQAPELLATLIVMLDQIDDAPRTLQYFDHRLLERARSAIAKAKGEA